MVQPYHRSRQHVEVCERSALTVDNSTISCLIMAISARIREKIESRPLLLGFFVPALSGYLVFTYILMGVWAWANNTSISVAWGPFSSSGALSLNGTSANYSDSTTGQNGLFQFHNSSGFQHPPCGDSNWSAGSAFFAIVVLVCGNLTHPRGSSIFRAAGRTWRLSPVFAGFETVVIFVRALRSMRRSYSARVTSYALLAIRTGNAWHEQDYEQFGETCDAMIDVATTALLASTSQALGNDSPATLEESNSASVKHRSKCRAAFSVQLHMLDQSERGRLYRVIIWVLMLLQVLKIGVVSGALFSQIVGLVFFFSWLTVEVLSIVISWHTITPSEEQKAIELGESFHAPNWGENEGEYPLMQNTSPKFAQVLLFFYAAFLFFAFGTVVGASNYLALALSFMIVSSTLLPWPMIWIGTTVLFIWSWSGARDRFGPLWYEKSMRVPGQWADVMGLYPAYLAIYGLVLAVLLYAGVGNAKDWFPCWQTSKPSWYNWLG